MEGGDGEGGDGEGGDGDGQDGVWRVIIVLGEQIGMIRPP